MPSLLTHSVFHSDWHIIADDIGIVNPNLCILPIFCQSGFLQGFYRFGQSVDFCFHDTIHGYIQYDKYKKQNQHDIFSGEEN